MNDLLQRSYQERVRGEARKKWLQQIVEAGETSAARMEPVYKAVFQSLYKVSPQTSADYMVAGVLPVYGTCVSQLLRARESCFVVTIDSKHEAQRY